MGKVQIFWQSTILVLKYVAPALALFAIWWLVIYTIIASFGSDSFGDREG